MIINTLDGIGRHEMERDVEIGDELEAKVKRAVEEADIKPTKKNIARVEKLSAELDAYATKIEQKYKV